MTVSETSFFAFRHPVLKQEITSQLQVGDDQLPTLIFYRAQDIMEYWRPFYDLRKVSEKKTRDPEDIVMLCVVLKTPQHTTYFTINEKTFEPVFKEKSK